VKQKYREDKGEKSPRSPTIVPLEKADAQNNVDHF